MSLESGFRLDHYEIAEMIGKGGMGEVYRATDIRLPREVAIKTAQTQFSDRFAREAKVIASLNHPNICTLFDVGPNYLVMEMIEGPTLADRIKAGALGFEEAVGIMRQVADALDYAHEKGVVHRDLKPGNIKIRPDGVVKVLDFGLAKVGPTSAASGEPENSPTMTIEATQAGVVLGTAAYMSPEQALGKPVDKRADVWAFGVVFYEMLTGTRMHKGESVQEIMAGVLKDEPDLTKAPPQTRRLLKRCLEKDPNKRLRHVGDVMSLVDETPVGQAISSPANAAMESATKKSLWPAVTAAVIVAAAVALWAPWRKPTPTQAVRFEVGPADKMAFISQAAMAVSPDGRWMVFPATGEDGAIRYYLRSLDGVEVRVLPGTDGGTAAPAAWSNDSRWVLFSNNQGSSKLKKVDIQGGPPQTIGDFPGNLGGAGWNSDGVIIAGTGGPIVRVPASGGQPTPITALAPGETAHRWPQFLPDGKHFLYLRTSSDAAKAGVYIGSLDVQPDHQSMQRLLTANGQAYYAPAPGGGRGHLIFLRQTTLMAQPFDPDKMTLTGEPAAIAEGVDSFRATNHALFSVSDTGTLVYRGGSGPQTVLAWFDLQGNPAGTLGDPGDDYIFPAISPDGSRVAVALGPAGSRDVWILDVAGGAIRRFTFDPANDDSPAWSPDGKNIAFSSNRGGQMDLYIKPADGSVEEKLLFKSDEPKTPERFTKDGHFLLFSSIGKNAEDIWALPYPGEAKPVPLLQTQFRELAARVSPDGRWLAYTSTESGTAEIYVRPFTPEAPAGTGAMWLVSKGGGVRAIWRADSKGLFYANLGFQVMAVDIDTSKGFQAGTPRRLFTAPLGALGTGWDLSPDGKRFLVVAPPNAGRVTPFTVVLNWAAGLKK